ncbi:MAG: hypothetical protein NTZ52_01150 [Chlamydiae bacterium]|nr:hypothetical protein [Chlamydiota bacterium]
MYGVPRKVAYKRTDCCKTCGHSLQLVDRGLHVIASGDQAIDLTREHLKKGLILAIRNTGAFLLLKAKEIAYTTSIAEEILTSSASTIV